MANIGTFTKNEAGAFIGEIVTLSFQAKNVRLIPETNRANENARATRLCRPRRDRRRLAQALRRTARLPLGQARRSELQRSDLREPLQRRRGRQLHPDLVAAAEGPARPPPIDRSAPRCPAARRASAAASSHADRASGARRRRLFKNKKALRSGLRRIIVADRRRS
jgi:hypothetical protein